MSLQYIKAIPTTQIQLNLWHRHFPRSQQSNDSKFVWLQPKSQIHIYPM